MIQKFVGAALMFAIAALFYYTSVNEPSRDPVAELAAIRQANAPKKVIYIQRDLVMHATNSASTTSN